MEYSQFFENKTRSNGDKFYALKDAAPEKLSDFIEKIHSDHFFGALPNDWIYDTIHSAFLDQEDGSAVDPEADCYNSELYKWLNNGFADEYCNEALQDGLANPEIWSIISAGQYLAKTRIYDAVYEFLQNDE